MPLKKKRTTRTIRHKMIETKTEDMLVPVHTSHDLEPVGEMRTNGSRRNLIIICLLIVLLAGIFLVKNGLIVAAMVNGKPIFRWDLTSVMMSRFGKQTLESIISEALIHDSAGKAGVVATKEEVAAKEAEILKSMGGESSIEELLKFQGITKDEFDRQISLQLTVQKLLGKDIQITDSDIDAFIATNQASLTASDPAQLREEARRALLDQKVGEKVQPWFTDLKNKAKIIRFL